MTTYHLNALPMVVLGLFLACWGAMVPLNSGLNIGGDDEFELCSSQLIERHPEMAGRLDNDQPWLHTIVIARIFALFGEYAAIPRVLNLVLTFVLVVACWWLMGPGTGPLAKILFFCFYFASNDIPSLTASAMLEIPALGLAVTAVACSYSWGSCLPSWRAYLAGVVMALAVFTKLTALVVVSGWLVLLWQQRGTVSLTSVLARIAGGFLAVSAIIIYVSPTFSPSALWTTHWEAHKLGAANGGHPFDFRDVTINWVIFIPILLGIVWQFKRPAPARLGAWFAAAWILTDFGVHLWHHPWWSYYSLHFAIPMAILAAQGTGPVFERAWNAISKATELSVSFKLPGLKRKWELSENISVGCVAMAASIITASWCGIQLPAFFKECESVCTTDTVEDNAFIPYIKKYGAHANWIYCNDENIAFFGGVLQPPELILKTYKRILTGRLDDDKIVEIVRSYHPDLLLLRMDGEMQDKGFQKLIAEGKYVGVTWSNGFELWVAPERNPVKGYSPAEIVRLLGL